MTLAVTFTVRRGEVVRFVTYSVPVAATRATADHATDIVRAVWQCLRGHPEHAIDGTIRAIIAGPSWFVRLNPGDFRS